METGLFPHVKNNARLTEHLHMYTITYILTLSIFKKKKKKSLQYKGRHVHTFYDMTAGRCL